MNEAPVQSLSNKDTSIEEAKKKSDQRIKQTILEEHGYTVIKQIGSGGYATVKSPLDYLRKFVPRELSVVKGLHHENIIRYYRSIETTHRIYIIMQYAENGSLLDLIRKEKKLSEKCAKTISKQLLSALEYIHSKGIVHRDIKCENIMFDRNGKLKLIDFGFARGEIKSAITLSDTYCGSYAYACPEILQGIPYETHYADLWAAGVVVFSMIYGQLPFDDKSVSLLIKQIKSKIKFPKIPENISNECKNFIEKLLAPYALRPHMDQLKSDVWLIDSDSLECDDRSIE